MKKQDLVGRKIVDVVRRKRYDTTDGGVAFDLLGIKLDSGWWLRFVVVEQADGGEYIVEGIYPGKPPDLKLPEVPRG